MAERKYSLKELNYIAEKIIANQQMDFVDSDIVASVLPDEHKNKAQEIFQAMKQDGIIDSATNGIAQSQHSVATIISYFNSNPNLTPEQREVAEKNAVEAIKTGDFSQIRNDEYFIIDNSFKLSYEGGKTTLTPVTNEYFITSNFAQFYNLIEQGDDVIDTFDLSASHNGEQIEGVLGLKRNDTAISSIGELTGEQSTAFIGILSRCNSIPTADYIIFATQDNERADEAAQRLMFPDTLSAGDALFKNGVLYEFINVNGETVIKPTQYDKNAEIVDNIAGYRVEQPKSVADKLFEDEFEEQPISDSITENGRQEQQQDVSKKPEARGPNDVLPEDKYIDAQSVKISNSPYFGNGETKTYTGQDKTTYSNFYTRTLNSNESMRIATEIKINQLYNERNHLRDMEKSRDRGLFGLLRKLLRMVRNIVYAVAKPIAKHVPLIFDYNKEMDKLKREIKSTKAQYYAIENNNKEFIKRYGLDVKEHDIPEAEKAAWEKKVAQAKEKGDIVVDLGAVSQEQYRANVGRTTPSEQNAEHNAELNAEPQEITAPQPKQPVRQAKVLETNKPIPHYDWNIKPSEQVALQMASSPVMGISMQTEKGTKKTIVTLNRPKEDGSIEEIKLDYDPRSKEKLTNLTNAKLSKEEIASVLERILVAQQISRSAKGHAGISEESWNKQDSKGLSKAQEAQKLISGEMQRKSFYVNGIEVKASVNGDQIVLSAFGKEKQLSLDEFAEDPRAHINDVAFNMAINKQIVYMCEKLPDMLTGSPLIEGSAYFKDVTDNKVNFQEPKISETKGGRPIVSMPVYLGEEGKQSLPAVIVINTNDGSIKWDSTQKEKFGQKETKQMEQLLGIVKGKYASAMLSFTSPEVIYGDTYKNTVENSLNNALAQLSPTNKDISLVLSGANLHISMADSGTIKVHIDNSLSNNPQEVIAYGGEISEEKMVEIIEKTQALGRNSLMQDRNNFGRAEALHSNERNHINPLTMAYGNARHGEGTLSQGMGKHQHNSETRQVSEAISTEIPDDIMVDDR